MTHPSDWPEERIYSANYGPLIRLHPDPVNPETGVSTLEVMCDVGDQETVVVLDLDGVIKLRRYLQRFEAAHKRIRQNG